MWNVINFTYVYIICLYFGLSPVPVRVANQGLSGFPTKNVIILQVTVTGQGGQPNIPSAPIPSASGFGVGFITHVIIAMQETIRFSEESVQPLRRQCGTCDPALGRIDPRVGHGGEDHWKWRVGLVPWQFQRVGSKLLVLGMGKSHL